MGTGDIVTDGVKEYTIVQLGELNGDGKVAAADYMLIKRAITGTSITEAQKTAADVDKNGTVAAADYMRVKRHITGKYNIYA